MHTLKSRRAMLDTLMRHLDMVRLSAGMVATIATIALVGCAGLISGSGDPAQTPEQRAAIQAWEQYAAPVFTTNCVACHAGTDPATAFLTGANIDAIRVTLLGWDPQVVNLDAPESSRVLTKGAHTGPALGATDSANILKWIQAEHDAANTVNPAPQLETAMFAPSLCTGGTAGDLSECGTGDTNGNGVIQCCPINIVRLDELHLPGAEIDFVAQPLGSDLYISDLYLKASSDGVYLEHPLFASWPAQGNPIPDSIDRFFAVKMNLAAATGGIVCPGPSCDHIGNGAAAFVGFAPQNQLTIHFKVLDPYHMDAMPPPMTVGCGPMGFAAFLANAKPALQQCATQCHGGANPGAKSALDMSGLASTTDNTTCLQVRGHVNLQNAAASPVLLAPDPASDPAHPGKFGTNLTGTLATFQNSMTAWINIEVAGN